MGKRFVIGISGASGSIYGVELIRQLAGLKGGLCEELHIIPSVNGLQVVKHEMGRDLVFLLDEIRASSPECAIIFHDPDNLFAPPASGSFPHDGMAVVPCSMGTLGALASGAVGNLLGRAADVTLKESRNLVLLPRESPLNLIHLENMVRLARAGAKIVPPMPGFYHHPESIEELVLQSVGRVIEQLGAGKTLVKAWEGV
jgi:flavin prenyltransferase